MKENKFLEENLEYMDENKTGALLKLSVRMGALLAKCTEEDVERLTSYAKKNRFGISNKG